MKYPATFDKVYDKSTHHTDSLADILMDTILNTTPLELERLHKWHISLLFQTPSCFIKIKLGVFRDYDEMQIVSGVIGKEKVHFVGVPAKRIDNDVDALLKYINTSDQRRS